MSYPFCLLKNEIPIKIRIKTGILWNDYNEINSSINLKFVSMQLDDFGSFESLAIVLKRIDQLF